MKRVIAVTAVVLASTLPARLEAQCTLPGGPSSLVSFEPNPPGVPRSSAPHLSAGFSSNVALYRGGGSGPYRLLMQESFGYSVLDLSNPVNPTALAYHDVRYPIGGPNSIRQAGDGQSFVQTISVSPDGQRVAFSTNGPTTLDTVVGKPNGDPFILSGDFGNGGANGTLIQHIGSRYIAYDIQPNSATASDVTTLPTGSLTKRNMASQVTGWSGGYLASIAGNYLVYQSGGGVVRVVDASAPGPIGNITAGYPQTTITSADFGGRSIAYVSAAVDPADPSMLWVLAELSAQAGENSPSYGLVYLTSNLAKFSAGLPWRVPSQPGDTWSPDPGPSSALIPGNGGLFVFMWAQRTAPSLFYKLYSTTVAAWGSVAPGVIDIPTSVTPGHQMRGFAAATGNLLYAYLPTGPTAWVIPMSCFSVNAPAVASMSVVDQAGVSLNNNDTVFLGDQVTITPIINPAPASQPLTGFLWNFDFDFHAGAPSEDNGAGASPRIKARDNGAFGNPAAPPDQITVIGPCDFQMPGVSPSSGAGCWNSVTGNGAFGGPDFGAVPVAGSTKALSFALEANNILGSAGARLFTLTWKVPKAQLQSTQVLSGQPLVSNSEGHPTATGFKWYFGDNPAALGLAACNGPSCIPTLDTKGTHSYWLRASYANGFSTPDYAGAAMGTYTVTDFAPAFTVNGATSGPITAITNQNLTIANSSKRGSAITANYQYSFCLSPPCADNYGVWPAMTDPPAITGTPATTAPIPIPAVGGTYALKIKVNYTGGTAYWPDPAGVTYFPVNVLDVSPLDVAASVSPQSTNVGQAVTFSCNVTGGLAPYSYQWRSPISFAIPGATQQTWQTTSAVAGDFQAYCFVTDSQPSPATSWASATATFTAPPRRPPASSRMPTPRARRSRTSTAFSSRARRSSSTRPGRTSRASPLALTGTASAFTGPAGATYTLLDSTTDYGTIAAGATADSFTAGRPSYRLSVSNPATRPAAHWDATFLETLSNGIAKTWTLHVGQSFTDVPISDGAYPFVENLFHNGITAGCGGGNYCPASNVTRWQMAVFLAKAMVGPSGTVPVSGTVPSVGTYNCVSGGTSLFADVPPTDGGCPFVHYIYANGVTAGCGGGNYCPAGNVTRWQMAVFLANGHGRSERHRARERDRPLGRHLQLHLGGKLPLQ